MRGASTTRSTRRVPNCYSAGRELPAFEAASLNQTRNPGRRAPSIIRNGGAAFDYSHLPRQILAATRSQPRYLPQYRSGPSLLLLPRGHVRKFAALRRQRPLATLIRQHHLGFAALSTLARVAPRPPEPNPPPQLRLTEDDLAHDNIRYKLPPTRSDPHISSELIPAETPRTQQELSTIAPLRISITTAGNHLFGHSFNPMRRS